MKTSTTALYARDSIIRLATTPAHKGNLASAARELSAMPGWARRPEAMAQGLDLAREMVLANGSAKAAEKVIDAA